MAAWSSEDVIQQEMEAYDDLPPSVRKFLAEHKHNVPAARLLEVYNSFGNSEDRLWDWINSIRILAK